MGERSGMALGIVAALVLGLVLFGATRAGRAPGDLDPHGAEMPADELNRVLRAAAGATASTPKAELEAQGEKLFRSSQLAKRGESCQGCHTQGGGVNDELGPTPHQQAEGPLGPANFNGVRDAPSLWGVDRTAPYGWIGDVDSLEAMVANTLRNHFRDQDPKPERVAAIVAYLKTLRPPLTVHDQGRLSAEQLRGEEIFVGKGGCIGCHGGPLFTDNLVHDTDVPQLPGANDPGAPDPPGGFNTPQMRDLRSTAPYMHNGVFQSLEEVVDFYDRNLVTGGPLRLTPEEKRELVEYLKTL